MFVVISDNKIGRSSVNTVQQSGRSAQSSAKVAWTFNAGNDYECLHTR